MKQEIKSLIKQGVEYAVVNDIYPPKWSIIQLIGTSGSYTHIKLWNTRKGACSDVVDNGGILCTYKVIEEGKQPDELGGAKKLRYMKFLDNNQIKPTQGFGQLVTLLSSDNPLFD